MGATNEAFYVIWLNASAPYKLKTLQLFSKDRRDVLDTENSKSCIIHPQQAYNLKFLNIGLPPMIFFVPFQLKVPQKRAFKNLNEYKGEHLACHTRYIADRITDIHASFS